VNCSALVVQQNEDPPFNRILIPSLDLDQLSRAVENARFFGPSNSPEIKVIRIFNPKRKIQDRQAVLEKMGGKVDEFRRQNPDFSGTIAVEGIEDPNPVSGITRASAGFDAVLLGASRQKFYKKWLFGSKPRLISEKVEPPVILIRPKAPVLNFGFAQLIEYIRGGYKTINLESEKKLEEDGMLARRGEEGTVDLHTRVNMGSLVANGVTFFSSILLMYLGRGKTITWVGTALFFVSFVWFTWLSLNGTGMGRRGRNPARRAGSPIP
jgi:nucleotide-binding universal stress UspA family protein